MSGDLKNNSNTVCSQIVYSYNLYISNRIPNMFDRVVCSRKRKMAESDSLLLIKIDERLKKGVKVRALRTK